MSRDPGRNTAHLSFLLHGSRYQGTALAAGICFSPCLECLPWFSSLMGCNLEGETNPFIHKLLWVMLFMTATESKQGYRVNCDVIS